jgi:hypothetical protein
LYGEEVKNRTLSERGKGVVDMSRKRKDERRHEDLSVQSRRGFLTTLGVAGGALMSGTAWAADRGRPTAVHQSGRQRLQRSSADLRLQKPLQLQRSERLRRPKQFDTVPSLKSVPRPSPSTRNRALKGVFDSPGSRLKPEDFGIPAGRDGTYSPSSTLQGATGDPTLAAAFAAGVSLTPAGCQFAEGVEYGGPDPITYWTRRGQITPERFGQMVEIAVDGTGVPFLHFRLRTPGNAGEVLIHLIELSMPRFGSDNYDVQLGTSPDEDGYATAYTSLDFVEADDGTQFALVEIPGAPDAQWTASIVFVHDDVQEYRAHFNWLNVIAL